MVSARARYSAWVDFPSYARQSDRELDLLTGALLIARDAYPLLDPAAEERRLDELAEPLRARGLGELPASLQAKALADYLYVSCGFRGNVDQYHDPDNSHLNIVLERRLGIPISLAIVYMEVARRVGVRAGGVGFPGHFLVRIEDDSGSLIVDPFFGGDTLDRAALQELLQRTAPRMTMREEMLQSIPVRHMITRLLMNLRAIYAARGDGGKLLVVLDHLIDLVPDAVDEMRDRGYLYARLGAPHAAVADLTRYAEALPHAGDAAEVRQAIEKLQRSRLESH